MCEEFSKTFLQISSACIPSKTILIREKEKPWFSNEIRKEIRIRDPIIILFVFESNCGRVTFSSSSFDIELKYLFNNSHLSEYEKNSKGEM
jgi:hypothetical protein